MIINIGDIVRLKTDDNQKIKYEVKEKPCDNVFIIEALKQYKKYTHKYQFATTIDNIII